MAKNSLDYSPLLSKQGDETDYGYVRKISPFVVSVTKWTLRTLIFIIFVSWAAFIFLSPSERVYELFTKWLIFSRGTSFGITGFYLFFFFGVFFTMLLEFKANYCLCVVYAGSILMSHSVPVLAIAFLAIAHLIVSGEDQLPEYVNSTTFFYFCNDRIHLCILHFDIVF